MYKIIYSILLLSFSYNMTIDEVYDNSYALIIGIDNYQNVQGLDYAVKDAEDIRSMIIDKFGFKQENITLLTNQEATKVNIKQEFSNITDIADINDRVLIFFAGHGETETLPNGGEMGYLIPVDGDMENLYVSSIDMDEIKKISARSKAKHILYLVDACYGGVASIGTRGLLDPQTTSNYIDKITKYKSRQIISAGGRGEQVVEKAEWGHSAFTKNILSGLGEEMADADDDGVITAQELGMYLKKKVGIDSEHRQTPKFRNITSDEGEFIFFSYETTSESNDRIDLPIKDTASKQPVENPANKLTDIMGTSYHMGDMYDNILFGVDKEWFIKNGKTSILFNTDFCYHFKFLDKWSGLPQERLEKAPDEAVHMGVSYRKYFIKNAFGNLHMNIACVNKNDYVYYGLSPAISVGYIFDSIITTMELGYLWIIDDPYEAGYYDDLPHGINISMKFGFYKRKYENTTIVPK